MEGENTHKIKPCSKEMKKSYIKSLKSNNQENKKNQKIQAIPKGRKPNISFQMEKMPEKKIIDNKKGEKIYKRKRS